MKTQVLSRLCIYGARTTCHVQDEEGIPLYQEWHPVADVHTVQPSYIDPKLRRGNLIDNSFCIVD
ncbi:MAG: hypothetical protein ACXWF8_09395 [Methylobacter sp.]